MFSSSTCVGFIFYISFFHLEFILVFGVDLFSFNVLIFNNSIIFSDYKSDTLLLVGHLEKYKE